MSEKGIYPAKSYFPLFILDTRVRTFETDMNSNGGAILLSLGKGLYL